MSVAARYRYTANLHLQRKETFLRKANLSKVFYSLPLNFSNPSVGKCDGLIIIISQQLQKELPRLRGFSVTNIKNMRSFYEEWSPFVKGLCHNSLFIRRLRR